MAELIIRDMEPAVGALLQERAERNCRSVEEEYTAILRDALLGSNGETPPVTFEAFLRTMPDVGTDADFARVEGTIREVNLTD